MNEQSFQVTATNKQKMGACDRVTEAQKDRDWVKGTGRRLGQSAMGT